MTPTELEARLRGRIAQACHGDRLPPMRALMREYKVGQAALQDIFGRMVRQGLLHAQAGRGTFVHKPGTQEAPALSRAKVLVLSARVQTARSHRVAGLVQAQLAQAGAKCVQLVYERIDEALEVLKLGARFDACILQSYFDAVPVGLLAFLRERCGAVVADGARVTGVDLDAVASDWRGALDLAVHRIRAHGHRRIALLAWPGSVQPLEGLRHHFISLRRALGASSDDMPVIELARMPRPAEGADALMTLGFERVWDQSQPRPTALIALDFGPGVSTLQTAITARKLRVPNDLSVVVLGHVDSPSGTPMFDVIGSKGADAAAALVSQLEHRLSAPASEHGTVYLNNHWVEAGSLLTMPTETTA